MYLRAGLLIDRYGFKACLRDRSSMVVDSGYVARRNCFGLWLRSFRFLLGTANLPISLGLKVAAEWFPAKDRGH